MKDFEKACEEPKIPLFGLPPARPTYNGKIERSNRIFREEFYDDLTEDTIVGSRSIPLECISKYKSGDSLCLTSV